MYFEWTDSLNIGVAEIDHQHQRIAHYINALHDARQTNERDTVSEVLDGLIDYTIDHFSFEEQLMEQAGYSYLGAHQRVHELFGKKVAEYRGRFANGEAIADELLDMLKYWLAHHIDTEDRGYVSSVKKILEDDGQKSWISGLVKKIFG
jgi:hemerythrin